MPTTNNQVLANSPVVTATTATMDVLLTGGGVQDEIAGSSSSMTGSFDPYHLLLSNIGAANLYVSTMQGIKGVLLAPGSAMNLALSAGAKVYVTRVAAQAAAPDLSIMVF